MNLNRRMIVVVGMLILVTAGCCADTPAIMQTALRIGDEGTFYMLASLSAAPTAVAALPADIGSRLRDAIRAGDAAEITRLVDAGAVPAMAGGMDAYMSPRVLAALSASVPPVPVMAVVLAGDTPLMCAARCGNCAQIAALLAMGVNARELHPYTGQTAAQIAVAGGHRDAAVLLEAVAMR
jgi:hypothetical protein